MGTIENTLTGTRICRAIEGDRRERAILLKWYEKPEGNTLVQKPTEKSTYIICECIGTAEGYLTKISK